MKTIKTKTKKLKPIKRFASWNDLKARCDAGDAQAQQCVIGALSNLGGEGLADDVDRGMLISVWERHYRGLQSYLMSLVGEYHMDESKAERDVLAEINCARNYSDDIDLERASSIDKLNAELNKCRSVAAGEAIIRSCSMSFLRDYVVESSGAAPWDRDRAAVDRASKVDLIAAVRQVWIDRLLVQELISIATMAFESYTFASPVNGVDAFVEARRRLDEIAGKGGVS